MKYQKLILKETGKVVYGTFYQKTNTRKLNRVKKFSNATKVGIRRENGLITFVRPDRVTPYSYFKKVKYSLISLIKN